MGKQDKKDKKARAKVETSVRLTVRKLPKTECCVAKKRCQRCPVRMLKDGTLPDGYTVKKRTLVSAKNGKKVSKKDLQRAA